MSRTEVVQQENDGKMLAPNSLDCRVSTQGPMFINSKRMQIQRGRGAELVTRVGIYSPHCPLSFGGPPTPPAALGCHLSSLCLLSSPDTVGLLRPAHIQSGIITLQTKHVLLSLEDGLSAETSCILLCSSWLRILVNCSHRGRHFLPEATVSSP